MAEVKSLWTTTPSDI